MLCLFLGRPRVTSQAIFAHPRVRYFFLSMSDTKSKAFASLCCWYVLCFPLSAVGDDGDIEFGFADIIDGSRPPNIGTPV